MTEFEVREKILVVEDSKEIRNLLGEILEDEGYQVFYAENGLQALEQVPQVRPQLILMDLSLPEVDGWEVVQRLRATPDFITIPIIAITAHATKSDREKALEIGCNGYISKPFEIDIMLKCVAELI